MRYRIRYGEIICELIEPPEDKNLNRGVIVLSGLPNQPRNDEFDENLSKEGYYVLQPRYIGSWESDGDFSIANCMKTVILAEELLLKGEAIECYNEKQIKWKVSDTYIMGSSFAPAIFLSTIDSLKTDKFVCLCPLTDLNKHHSDINVVEQDLEFLYGFLQRGYKNAFRNFEEKDWKLFIQGKSIANPISYVNKIKNKNILLIHGDKDTTINVLRTKNFYEKIKNDNKVELKIFEGIGHGRQCREASFSAILDWLKNN